MRLRDIWPRRYYSVLVLVNAINVGAQAGSTLYAAARRDWSAAVWRLAALCVATFALYFVRYTEEWRVRMFAHIAAQRALVDREIAIRDKAIAAMAGATRVSVEVVDNSETKH